MHFTGITENSSSLGVDLKQQQDPSLFENHIQKLFFLCIKASDFLEQSCNASVGTGLVDVSFVLRFLLQRVQLFLLLPGRPKRTLYSKKYGVDLIRYTHAANTVVYSSNKIDGK